MCFSLTGHLNHRISAFGTELLSQWLDDEERYFFIFVRKKNSYMLDCFRF